jgi:hypothetical protein
LIPMNDIVKKIFLAVAIIGLVIWVLPKTGLWSGSF